MRELVNSDISANDVTTHQGFICEVLKCGTRRINAPPRSRGKHISPLCLSLATLIAFGPNPQFPPPLL